MNVKVKACHTAHIASSRQEEIESLTRDILIVPPSVDDKSRDEINKLENICYKLIQIFEKNQFRPHYFFVHKLIQDVQISEPALKEIHARLNMIVEYIENKDNFSQLIKQKTVDENMQFRIKMFFKALEYEIQLKTYALMLEGYSEKIKKASNDLKIAQNSLENINVDELNEKVNASLEESRGLLANSIAVLGIFIAIITAIFGSEEFTSSAIYVITETLGKSDTIGNNSVVFIFILLIVISAMVVVNLVFMFTFILSRLIKKDIGTNCFYHEYKDNDNTNGIPKVCASCKNKCSFYNKLKNRFSYIYYTEIFLVGAFWGLVTAWVVKAGIYDPIMAHYYDSTVNIVSPKFICAGIEVLGTIVLIFFIIKGHRTTLYEMGVRLDNDEGLTNFVSKERIKDFKRKHFSKRRITKIVSTYKLSKLVRSLQQKENKSGTKNKN